mmetsp:Transcript_18605/g.53642  ORF Transcript_18605/g.53642 Transcript_18605/m.53642 type:complete len:142 (-) Transcript_18605:1858-2283(-)
MGNDHNKFLGMAHWRIPELLCLVSEVGIFQQVICAVNRTAHAEVEVTALIHLDSPLPLVLYSPSLFCLYVERAIFEVVYARSISCDSRLKRYMRARIRQFSIFRLDLFCEDDWFFTSLHFAALWVRALNLDLVHAILVKLI